MDCMFPVIQDALDELIAVSSRHGKESLLSDLDLLGLVPEGLFDRATLLLPGARTDAAQGQGCLVSVERSQPVPETGDYERTDAYLQAVEEGRSAFSEESHLPEVRVLVFGAGGGPRMSCLGHAKAGFDEGLHESGDAPELGAADAVGG